MERACFPPLHGPRPRERGRSGNHGTGARARPSLARCGSQAQSLALVHRGSSGTPIAFDLCIGGSDESLGSRALLASHQRTTNLEREGLPCTHEEPASIETLKITARARATAPRSRADETRERLEGDRWNTRRRTLDERNARANTAWRTRVELPETGLQTVEGPGVKPETNPRRQPIASSTGDPSDSSEPPTRPRMTTASGRRRRCRSRCRLHPRRHCYCA